MFLISGVLGLGFRRVVRLAWRAAEMGVFVVGCV